MACLKMDPKHGGLPGGRVFLNEFFFERRRNSRNGKSIPAPNKMVLRRDRWKPMFAPVGLR